MGESVRVDSIDVLKEFKTALWKFQEAATVALGDAESEMHRVLMWLQTEQDSHWQHQIRKREEIVGRCKEAVRMKTIFKDATGRQQSAIEEQKALKIALRNLEEAQQKLAMVRKWSRVLPKEIEMYKGSVQRFATTVQSEIPVAASHLEKLAQKLEAYVAVEMEAAAAASGGQIAGATQPSMGRGGAGIPGLPADEFGRLIAQIPSPDARASAPVSTEILLPIPIISAEQQVPAMLPVTARRPPAADKRIFVSIGLEKAPRVFLHHHHERSSAEDSGWSIAPAQAAEGLDWRAIRAGDLLAARPDLADLLGLPPGFSVIIDSAGISDVIDARKQPAWRRG
jgi:hypothetical protein